MVLRWPSDGLGAIEIERSRNVQEERILHLGDRGCFGKCGQCETNRTVHVCVIGYALELRSRLPKAEVVIDMLR